MNEPLTTLDWNIPLVLSLAYTGVLVTGVSYWSGIVVNRELPTIVVSLGFLLVPVVSLLVSYIYLEETITLPTLAAMALIISGVYCVVAKE
jgi:drug/metabolite transporter (DMT)-like permease